MISWFKALKTWQKVGIVVGAILLVVILIPSSPSEEQAAEPTTTTEAPQLATTTAPTTTQATTTTQAPTTTQATTTTTSIDSMSLAIQFLRENGDWFDNNDDQHIKDVIVGACVLAYDADSASAFITDVVVNFGDEAEMVGAVIGVASAGQLCPTQEMQDAVDEVLLLLSALSEG